MRPQLLAWLAKKGKDEEALAHAERLAKSFLADRGSIDPSLVSTVLQLSAIRGDAALFEEYRKRFEAATAPTDPRSAPRRARELSRPRAPGAGARYSLRAEVRPHEVFEIPRAMADTPAHRQQVFEWTRANYDEIVKKIPGVRGVPPERGGWLRREGRHRRSEFFSVPEH